jgi:hypothetical protein
LWYLHQEDDSWKARDDQMLSRMVGNCSDHGLVLPGSRGGLQEPSCSWSLQDQLHRYQGRA